MLKIIESKTEEKQTLHCLRCGYTWTQKEAGRVPETCAKCRSPNWQKPKNERKKFTWKNEETKARARRKPKNR